MAQNAPGRLPKRAPSMRESLTTALRSSLALSPPPLASTPEEVEQQKAEAATMLQAAMAVYTVRVYARRWVRRRERAKEREQQLSTAVAGASSGDASVSLDPQPEAALAEVQVEVRRD